MLLGKAGKQTFERVLKIDGHRLLLGTTTAPTIRLRLATTAAAAALCLLALGAALPLLLATAAAAPLTSLLLRLVALVYNVTDCYAFITSGVARKARISPQQPPLLFFPSVWAAPGPCVM